MRTESALELSSTVHEQLTQHLLGKRDGNEQAAFAFAEYDPEDHGFSVVDWYPVLSEGFVVQLPYHFELTDETRAHVIKRAHDLAASIIEFRRRPCLARERPGGGPARDRSLPHDSRRARAGLVVGGVAVFQRHRQRQPLLPDLHDRPANGAGPAR